MHSTFGKVLLRVSAVAFMAIIGSFISDVINEKRELPIPKLGFFDFSLKLFSHHRGFCKKEMRF